MANQSAPRRRQTETVRERAAKEAARQARSTLVRRSGRRLQTGLGQAKRWLSQPLATHPAQAGSNGRVWQALTKYRSTTPRYVRLSWYELSQVQWLQFRQAMRLTSAVFIFAAVFVFLVAVLDWMLTKAFEEIILNETRNIRGFFEDLF